MARSWNDIVIDISGGSGEVLKSVLDHAKSSVSTCCPERGYHSYHENEYF